MSSVTAPPDVLRWTSRSGDAGDCVVAALELACGVSYEDALAMSLRAAPNVLREGMWLTEIPKVARLLGYRVRKHRAGTFEADESTGILHVYQPHRPKETSHVVYLWDGRVIEPKADRRQLWRYPDQFLRHYGYRAGALLTLHAKGERDDG